MEHPITDAEAKPLSWIDWVERTIVLSGVVALGLHLLVGVISPNEPQVATGRIYAYRGLGNSYFYVVDAMRWPMLVSDVLMKLAMATVFISVGLQFFAWAGRKVAHLGRSRR